MEKENNTIIEQKPIPFLKRIQMARVKISKTGLKMSGRNPHLKYNFWELKDFLPIADEIIEELDLFSEIQIDWVNMVGVLTITDVNHPSIYKSWTTKVITLELRGCNPMQSIAGTYTATKKILYQLAYDLAESDINEATKQQAEIEDEGNALIGLDEIEQINNLVKETQTETETMYKYYQVNNFTELTNKQFVHAIKALYKKVEQQKAQKKADELAQSLNINKPTHTEENNQIAFGGNR